MSGSRSGAAGDSRLSYFSPPYPTVSQKTDARRQSAVWLPVGLSFGCGIGIALRSLSLGVGIGLVFGVTMMIITRRRPERSAVRSLVSRYDPIPRKEEARCPASHAVVARARRLLRLPWSNEKEGEQATTSDPGQRHSGCWSTRRAASLRCRAMTFLKRRTGGPKIIARILTN